MSRFGFWCGRSRKIYKDEFYIKDMMEEEKSIKKSLEDYKNALDSEGLIVQEKSLNLLEEILFKNFKVVLKSKIVEIDELRTTAEELGLNRKTGTHLYNVLRRHQFKVNKNDLLTLYSAVDLYGRIQDCPNKVRQIGKVSKGLLEGYLKKKGLLED